MSDDGLALEIRRRALALGYEDCGIVGTDEMHGYAEALERRSEEYPTDRKFLENLKGFAEIHQTVPWAKSVIILVRSYGKYTVPDSLKGRIASAYLSNGIHIEGAQDNADSLAFGEYLTSLGIKAITDRNHGLTAMRWAAQKAGVGIIRKNTFIYTKNGSWVLLSAWLIDRALELKVANSLPSCPDNCRRCIDACPTRALQRPYSMQPTACVSFITGFGGDDLTTHPANQSLGEWIYGCDACQTACPHNQIPDRETEDIPGISQLVEKVSPTQILDMNDDALRELFGKRFWYIASDRIWKWKVNALNAMKNAYKDEYLPWIEKACHDPAVQVRSMAAWVLQSVNTF